jgi:hypothetical protein
MTDWKNYLIDSESNQVKKKRKKGPGCKRNKINKNRYGSCIFNEQEECMFCKRPRRKIVKLNPLTNKIETHYLE